MTDDENDDVVEPRLAFLSGLTIGAAVAVIVMKVFS